MSMSEQEFTESIEEAPFTEKDAEDLETMLGAEEVEYHSILQVWRTILDGAFDTGNRRITAKWATNVVSKYPQVTYADVPAHSEMYFAIIEDCITALDVELETDADCYKVESAEEDRERNSHHYKNVLRDWQLTFLESELKWDCTAPHAATDLSALNEAHAVFFGPTGLTSYLDAIQFEFTEDDQANLSAALQEFERQHVEAAGE